MEPFLQIAAIDSTKEELLLRPRRQPSQFTLTLAWFQFHARLDFEGIFIHSDASLANYDALGDYLFNFEAVQKRRSEEYREFVKLRTRLTRLRQMREDHFGEKLRVMAEEDFVKFNPDFGDKNVNLDDYLSKLSVKTQRLDELKDPSNQIEAIFEDCARKMINCPYMWLRVYFKQLNEKTLSVHDGGLSSVADEQRSILSNLINRLPPLEPSLATRIPKRWEDPSHYF